MEISQFRTNKWLPITECKIVFHKYFREYTAILVAVSRWGQDRLIDLEVAEQSRCWCGLALR